MSASLAASGAAARHEAFGMVWRSPLHGFQRDGMARRLATKAVLLTDEIGPGKTIQAIAALHILARRGKLRSALLVAQRAFRKAAQPTY